MHTELGKIEKVRFGCGGYQNAQIGFTFNVGGKGWGSSLFLAGGWSTSREIVEGPDSTYKWTHEGRIKQLGEKAWEAFELMKKAKVDYLHEMEGIPIKAHFESMNGRLLSIEILEEVL